VSMDPQRDLEITRTIKAPRSAVWQAWTDPTQFAQWWIPAPALCRVQRMEVRPGGALLTEMSEDGKSFGPHMDACYLEVEEGRKLVLTNALSGGWRPADSPFMTAVITLDDHDEGTAYRALVMHKDPETRAWHEEMGFFDGWGTVAAQLAALVER
jgi:uncharacterized protein YndB with AHSA1/START domain